MKIAFDFHGVLETYPEQMKSLILALKGAHRIVVLSGPPSGILRLELESCGYVEGFHYSQALSVVDWLKAKGTSMHQHENGSWYCDDDIWWSSKARICEEQDIDILFDDTLKYKEHIKNGKPLFLHIK